MHRTAEPRRVSASARAAPACEAAVDGGIASFSRRRWHRAIRRALPILAGLLAVLSVTVADAQTVLPATPYRAGMTQIEFKDPTDGRPLDFMLIYPANPPAAATPFKIFLSSSLHLYKDAPVVQDGLRHPLVIFSHGAGGNGSGYAWFGEYLATHGYLCDPTIVKICFDLHYRTPAIGPAALGPYEERRHLSRHAAP